VDGNGLVDKNGALVPEIKIAVSEDGKNYAFSRTYEFDGNPEFIVTMQPEDVKPLDGGGLDMEGWRYVNGQMVREKYTTADGVNTEKGMDLLSKDEAQAYLANPKNVDLSEDGRKNLRKAGFISWTRTAGYIQYEKVVGRVNFEAWGDNIIAKPDGKGGYTVVPTSRFALIGLYDQPFTLVDFTNADKKIGMILVDRGDLSDYNGPLNDTPKSLHEKWSGYYATNKPKFP
jgi:hypothetical protein